ncbi:MAG: redoxin domain-containing protein [Verrucomicrobiales bacterium]
MLRCLKADSVVFPWRSSRLIAVVMMLAWSAAPLVAQVPAAESDKPVSLGIWRSIDGRTHRLPVASETSSSRPPADPASRLIATVFIFAMPDCPAANRYWPEINRIATEFPRCRFFVVQVDADLTIAAAQQFAKDYQIAAPVLLDPEQKLSRSLGATMSPQAVVVSGAGKVLYCGRIDNRFAAFGKERPAPTKRDLREVLRAVSKGRPSPHEHTEVIGCHLPR